MRDISDGRKPIREKINKDIEEFLKSGGVIEKHKIYIRRCDENLKKTIRYGNNYGKEANKARKIEMIRKVNRSVQLRDEGKSVTEIAKIMGLQEQSVRRYFRKYKELNETKKD